MIKIGKTVIAEVRDEEGNVIYRAVEGSETECKENDLVNRNLIRVMLSVFTPDMVPLYNTTGDTVLAGLRTQHYHSPFGRIKVGDSDITPSRSDLNLKGNVLGDGGVSATVNETEGFLILSTSFSWASDTVVKEVGLFIRMNWLDYLMDRTVFSPPITVPAGKVLSIAYRFSF